MTRCLPLIKAQCDRVHATFAVDQRGARRLERARRWSPRLPPVAGRQISRVRPQRRKEEAERLQHHTPHPRGRGAREPSSKMPCTQGSGLTDESDRMGCDEDRQARVDDVEQLLRRMRLL